MVLLFCYFTCGAVGGCRKVLLGAEAAKVPRKEAPPPYPDRTVPRQKALPQSPTRKLHTGPPQDAPPHSPTAPWQDALPQFLDRTRYVSPLSTDRTRCCRPPTGRATAVLCQDVPLQPLAMTLHVLPQFPPRTCHSNPPPGRADAVSRLDIPMQSTARTLLRGSPPETPHDSLSETPPAVNRQKTTTRSPCQDVPTHSITAPRKDALPQSLVRMCHAPPLSTDRTCCRRSPTGRAVTVLCAAAAPCHDALRTAAAPHQDLQDILLQPPDRTRRLSPLPGHAAVAKDFGLGGVSAATAAASSAHPSTAAEARSKAFSSCAVGRRRQISSIKRLWSGRDAGTGGNHN